MINEVTETEYEPGELLPLTPEQHYKQAMGNLMMGENYGLDSPHRTNAVLTALTHTMLGVLRDGLDYSAKHPGGTVPPGPSFEEDETRP